MDLGKPGSGLCIPAAGPLYNPGRLAGSRIGSNSWGTAYVGAGYYNSQDTDNYLFNNMVRATAAVELVTTYMTCLCRAGHRHILRGGEYRPIRSAFSYDAGQWQEQHHCGLQVGTNGQSITPTAMNPSPPATLSHSESTLGGPNITSVAFYSSQGPTFDNR